MFTVRTFALDLQVRLKIYPKAAPDTPRCGKTLAHVVMLKQLDEKEYSVTFPDCVNFRVGCITSDSLVVSNLASCHVPYDEKLYRKLRASALSAEKFVP